MHQPANDPNDLERFFVERANAGDLEGLIALYEKTAIIDSGGGEILRGIDQIRPYLIKFLASHTQLLPSRQAKALCRDDLALTSSQLANGDITAEIARRQADGSWRWVVDQFALGNRR
ncbi:MAG: hypothetical protein V3V30_08720 [Parvularculaceae bacterium]